MRDFLGLKVSEDFRGDPYGYLTNQIGHIYLGFFFTTLYCFCIERFSTYPNQVVAIATVSLVYLVWWEILNQGWRGFDTLEDTFYFLGGSSVYLFVDMQWVIGKVLFAMTILWVFLLAGVIVRIKEPKDNDTEL